MALTPEKYSHGAKGYRLVAFDVDGTLIESRSNRVVWQVLNHRFGCPPEENERRFRAYLRGEISYDHWVGLDIGGWREAGATRQTIEAAIREDLYLVSGAREAISAIKDAGLTIAVISGTLDLTLSLLLPDIAFDHVFTNRIAFGDDHRICDWRATPYDMAGKVHALERICEDTGVLAEQAVFVGDNINDIDVMGAVGLAIAFQCKHESVAAAAAHRVSGDLRQIIPLILG